MSRAIVTTPESLCEVTWGDGRPVLTASSIAPAIEAMLLREREWPVGDKPPGPMCTAGFSVEWRMPGNEFEMLSVLLQHPEEISPSATVDILQT